MTLAKKLSLLEALFSDLSPKNSENEKNWKLSQKTQITGGSSLIGPPKKCTKKEPDISIYVSQDQLRFQEKKILPQS